MTVQMVFTGFGIPTWWPFNEPGPRTRMDLLAEMVPEVYQYSDDEREPGLPSTLWVVGFPIEAPEFRDVVQWIINDEVPREYRRGRVRNEATLDV